MRIPIYCINSFIGGIHANSPTSKKHGPLSHTQPALICCCAAICFIKPTLQAMQGIELDHDDYNNIMYCIICIVLADMIMILQCLQNITSSAFFFNRRG